MTTKLMKHFTFRASRSINNLIGFFCRPSYIPEGFNHLTTLLNNEIASVQPLDQKAVDEQCYTWGMIIRQVREHSLLIYSQNKGDLESSVRNKIISFDLDMISKISHCERNANFNKLFEYRETRNFYPIFEQYQIDVVNMLKK